LPKQIGSIFQHPIKFTAVTIGLVVSVSSFAQSNNCDSGVDYCDGGNPPGYGYPPDYPPFDPDPYPPGWGGGDDGGGGGGGGYNPDPGPDPAVCLALQQLRPDNCFTDPGGAYDLNWTSFIQSNYNEINPTVYLPENFYHGTPKFPYASSLINSTVSTVSSNYFSTADYTNSRPWIWMQLAQYCANNNASNLENCLTSQAEFLASIRPHQSGGNSSWYGEVSWLGVTIGYNPNWSQGNWVTDLLQQTDEFKECHLWYEHPDQDECNNGN
jgi:hypothetical protein